MRTLRRFWRRTRNFATRSRNGQRLHEEMEQHLALQVEESIRAGMSPEEARRQAVLNFGPVEAIRESYQAEGGLPVMETVLQDCRYSFRVLRKNPQFALVAVLTLALGIGANTAIFSVFNAVLLNPLPYAEPQRLISLRGNQSWPDLNDIKRQSRTIESIGAFWPAQYDLTGSGEPQQVDGAHVSLDLFQTLGVAPEVGRTFNSNEDILGGTPVVVISHSFWQQHMGSDRNVLAKTLELNGKAFRIIGVMPAKFWLPPGESQLWVPFEIGYPEAATARGVHAQYAIARLRDGSTMSQAQAELDSIAKGLEKLYPGENRGRRFIAMDLRERVLGNVRPMMVALLGSVGLVLLIAGFNFANLLLTKASSRLSEIKVRAALGASSARLIQQSLTESLLIAFIGGAAGLGVAMLMMQSLSFLKPHELPRVQFVTLDWHVLVFTALLCIGSGCMFGLAPALRIVLPGARNLAHAGKGAVGQSAATSRLRNGLIIGEVGIALMLLCGASLLLRTLWQLQSVDLGFNSSQLMTARVWPKAKKYSKVPVQDQFYSEVEQRLQQIPGISGTALVTELPLSGNRIPHNLVFNGRPPVPEGSEPDVLTNLVSPTYFSTMQMALLKGRVFERSDTLNAPLVAVVNEAMARQYFPGEEPVGKQVAYARANGPRQWITIIGVVGNTREFGADSEQEPVLYTPIYQKQEFWRAWAGIVVRSSGNDARVGDAIKQAIWAVDDQVPVTKVQPMSAMLSESLAQRKFTALLLGLFAASALMLAMIGIYGVVSYTVLQRTQEIGVRIALGATRRDVLGIIMKQASLTAVAGIVLGALGALAATRLLRTMLFGVTARDPFVLGGAAALLMLMAVAAAMVPALRAARTDPSSALRAE